ncbi:MAG: bifunctional phosphopantothenoylcysteine decarboxylase/phosphopantothenate--cysteine ligase CoaBC, partial [Nannocystaceae bacterium]
GKILLIVGGGIAAYKTPALVRALRAGGAEVQVVTTEAAGAFVTELALSTVSGRPVRSQLLDASEEGTVGHIELADWPDLVLVAPGTANLMSRAAVGGASDLASTVLLATRAPVVWAPAMNTNMWLHPATQANVDTLRGFGHALVGPSEGELACGWTGVGAMTDVPELAQAALEHLKAAGGVMKDQHVVVSAGPTRTYLDPVRFISNGSTGAMGFALARAAVERGAHVTLVAGPVDQVTPPGVTRVDVKTAAEMYEALDTALASREVALLAMVAAVSDVHVANPLPGKGPKSSMLSDLQGMDWSQERDLLQGLIERHGARVPSLAFAAQTLSSGEERRATLRSLGEQKLQRKGATALFVNEVGRPGVGFESATNEGLLLVRGSGDEVDELVSPPAAPKPVLAGWMLDRLLERGVIGSSS